MYCEGKYFDRIAFIRVFEKYFIIFFHKLAMCSRSVNTIIKPTTKISSIISFFLIRTVKNYRLEKL